MGIHLPRDQENTQVRDIMDMYLLVVSEKMDHNCVGECVYLSCEESIKVLGIWFANF